MVSVELKPRWQVPPQVTLSAEVSSDRDSMSTNTKQRWRFWLLCSCVSIDPCCSIVIDSCLAPNAMLLHLLYYIAGNGQ